MDIYARIDTKVAGIRITFFCYNVLVCRTTEPLQFLYSKRSGIFEKDNNNQLPAPVVNEPENQIIIFQNTMEMYATHASDSTAPSGEMILNPGGSIGDITVQTKDQKHSYNFGYCCSLWSASDTELFSTKIVEVAPKFILVNQTRLPLHFSQEQTGDMFVLVQKGERTPYHWADGSKPLLLKFKPYGSNIAYCAPFSLS